MQSRQPRPRPPSRAELPQVVDPKDKLDHDVLVFPRTGVVEEWQYFRIPVVKQARELSDGTTIRAGQFVSAPEKWDLSDHGERRVLSTARPQHYGNEDERSAARGPAFALLPVKPDPSSASFPTCFLINVQNLDSPNLWTVEEWNDGPGGPDYPTPQHPNEFEALVAGPRGAVFRLKITNVDAWRPGTQPLPNGLGEIEAVDLANESEIWGQLRNGCIAGRALFQDTSTNKRENKHRPQKRVIPLVNITALQPGLSTKV
ncbi:MAG TPA: hypothetical protein VFQ61_16030 [Polyangiaceae bacterium]|nr:hypothetical protein [Polyangiaceae bacterium]